MRTAVILAILLAAVGPIWLPFALARARRGAAYSFCLTNLLTLLPMIGIAAWARYLAPPSCRQLYPDSPCDGIPNEYGWILLAALFVGLALWSLIASAIATSCAFGNRLKRWEKQ